MGRAGIGGQGGRALKQTLIIYLHLYQYYFFPAKEYGKDSLLAGRDNA